MAINPRNRRPLRVLAALFVIVIGLYGLLASVHTWGEAQLTPKLGLDLEGGTQLILEPRSSATARSTRARSTRPSTSSASASTAAASPRPRSPPRAAATSSSRCPASRPRARSTRSASPPSCASAPCSSRRRTPRRPGTERHPAPTATPSAKATPPAGKATRPPRREGDRQAVRHGLHLRRVRASREALRAPRRPRDPHGPTRRRPPRRPGHARRDGPGDERPGPRRPAPRLRAATGANACHRAPPVTWPQITPAIEKQFTALDCTRPAAGRRPSSTTPTRRW